jgi:fermentation-respiration switch protein FrsA (DUF1100 family)
MFCHRSAKRLRRALGVLVGLCLLFVMLRWFEHSQVYHPSRDFDATGGELKRPFENVEFRAGDGVRLHGWFFPAEAGSPRANWAVLVCHGNGGNISHRVDLCGALLKTGVAVFLFDYRGYGRSQGRPGEEGTYLDAQAAFAWLRQRGFSGEHVIAFGESLGGGVVSELALREPLGGIVLQSTFTSIPDIGAEVFPWLPVRWINTIKYDTRAKLPRIKTPVLVMHSREDTLARFAHAEANFAAANAPKLLWELSGDHNDSVADSQHMTEGFEKFLRLLETQPAVHR